jgi:large subunit ribosomal protein L6e
MPPKTDQASSQQPPKAQQTKQPREKPKEKPKKKKNVPLKTKGGKTIPKYSRGLQFYRSLKHLLMRKIRKAGPLKPKPVTKPAKTVKVRKQPFKGKKAKEIVVQSKFARFSSTEPPRRKVVCTRKRDNPTRLRKSITPGTILIMLAGVYAGKRVVFLKQMASGLLLVTGPFKLNGVPLRRVNQRYVIATSTKVDIAAVKIPDTVDDKMFKAHKKQKARKMGPQKPKEKTLLATKPGTTGASAADKEKASAADREKQMEARKQLQKTLDEPIIAKIEASKHMKEYISSMFTLKKGQYPHEMIF